MKFGKKIKDQAMANTLNDPKVFEQVQKNTEKVLKKKEKETLIVAKAAIKELIEEKYMHLITEGLVNVLDQIQKESLEIINDEKKPSPKKDN